ncbi:MAG: AAA family ATPase [Sporichthyaceae bacterium]
MTTSDQLPIRRVEASEHGRGHVSPDGWPGNLAPVEQLLNRGLSLGPATVLVGENGSGKSTIVEAIAMAFGLNSEGGSTHARHSTRASESALHEALHLIRAPGASRWGYFLRAETMHGLYSYLEENPGRRSERRLHELSHGESFLEVLRTRFDESGLYVLDEPESALSFAGCLSLVRLLHDICRSGTAQVIVATHSPVVAALPGAQVYELSADGIEATTWDQLDLVAHHRRFLNDPGSYLRHLMDDDD